MSDVPSLYRVIFQVSDLERAAAFYTELLRAPARTIRERGYYIDCGAVIVALVNPTIDGLTARPTPDHTYFSVKDLSAVHSRAAALGCLSTELVGGRPAGEMLTRPWGEHSFYAADPWGNPLCFVEADSIFTGK